MLRPTRRPLCVENCYHHPPTQKGLTSDISNFRPIALMSCVYKLLMAIFGRHITQWAIANNILSDEQISGPPTESCYENGFLLQSLIGDARRLQKNVFLAWLDLRNAFGSVPHAINFTTLHYLGLAGPLVDFISNAYTDASTTIRTTAGIMPAMPIKAGVKQGYLPSAILFNLNLELVLRKVKDTAKTLPRGPAKHHNVPISVLPYADDLVLIGRKKDNLSTFFDAASTAESTIGLEFRLDKCASLGFTDSHCAVQRSETNAFRIQNRPIPPLSEKEHYRYLSIPFGLIHNIDNLPELGDRLIADIETIKQSLLAPWQKLDAIKTFVQDHPKKQSLEVYRFILIRVVRKICDLPTRASTQYIFATQQAGDLGFQDPIRECDIQTIVQAVKMLSSSDPTVSAIANAKLLQTVLHAAQTNPTPPLVSCFLSSTQDQWLSEIRYRT